MAYYQTPKISRFYINIPEWFASVSGTSLSSVYRTLPVEPADQSNPLDLAYIPRGLSSENEKYFFQKQAIHPLFHSNFCCDNCAKYHLEY